MSLSKYELDKVSKTDTKCILFNVFFLTCERLFLIEYISLPSPVFYLCFLKSKKLKSKTVPTHLMNKCQIGIFISIIS